MEMVGTILELMGWSMTPAELKEVVDEVDADGKYLKFQSYAKV